MNVPPYNLRGWQLFSVIAAVVAAMSMTTIAAQPELIEGLRSAIRATARSSFVLFLIAFTASAFAVLVPSPFSKALVRERRFIGLAFAFSHLVHAVLIYLYGQMNTEFWPARTVANNIPGGTAYILILLMTKARPDYWGLNPGRHCMSPACGSLLPYSPSPTSSASP
jgi:sulfoxide reductase heme-binding subunit YedZ